MKNYETIQSITDDTVKQPKLTYHEPRLHRYGRIHASLQLGSPPGTPGTPARSAEEEMARQRQLGE